MSEVIEPTIYVGVLAERFKAHDIHTDDEMFYVPERTCRNIDKDDGFTCSNCGCRIIEDDLTYLSGTGNVRFLLHYPRHCPDCGSKVVE